jgi:hypothetical protein
MSTWGVIRAFHRLCWFRKGGEVSSTFSAESQKSRCQTGNRNNQRNKRKSITSSSSNRTVVSLQLKQSLSVRCDQARSAQRTGSTDMKPESGGSGSGPEDFDKGDGDPTDSARRSLHARNAHYHNGTNLSNNVGNSICERDRTTIYNSIQG